MAHNDSPSSMVRSGLAQQYADFRLGFHFAPFVYAPEGEALSPSGRMLAGWRLVLSPTVGSRVSRSTSDTGAVACVTVVCVRSRASAAHLCLVAPAPAAVRLPHAQHSAAATGRALHMQTHT
jgi:hypothetical protein